MGAYSFCCSTWLFLSAFSSDSLIQPSPSSSLLVPYLFLVLVYSFYFLFHAVVVPTQFLVVTAEYLEHVITIALNAVSDGLLASISFSSFSGDSSTRFFWGFFRCLPISGDSLCLFPHLGMLHFACLSSWGGLLW